MGMGVGTGDGSEEGCGEGDDEGSAPAAAPGRFGGGCAFLPTRDRAPGDGVDDGRVVSVARGGARGCEGRHRRQGVLDEGHVSRVSLFSESGVEPRFGGCPSGAPGEDLYNAFERPRGGILEKKSPADRFFSGINPRLTDAEGLQRQQHTFVGGLLSHTFNTNPRR